MIHADILNILHPFCDYLCKTLDVPQMQVQNESYGYVIAEDRNEYPKHAHLKDTVISIEINIDIEG